MKNLKSKFNASKKLFFLALFFVSISSLSLAQSSSGIGFKAGLNYNANGNYFESISSNAQHPDRNI